MGMRIFVNDLLLLDQSSFDQEKLRFSAEVNMPGSVVIEVFNKQPIDTLLDDNHNIVKDKYIKIEKMTVDSMTIHPAALYDLVELKHNEKIVKGPYFGFNGRCVIPFNQTNSFQWHLDVLSRSWNTSVQDTVPSKYISLTKTLPKHDVFMPLGHRE